MFVLSAIYYFRPLPVISTVLSLFSFTLLLLFLSSSHSFGFYFKLSRSLSITLSRFVYTPSCSFCLICLGMQSVGEKWAKILVRTQPGMCVFVSTVRTNWIRLYNSDSTFESLSFSLPLNLWKKKMELPFHSKFPWMQCSIHFPVTYSPDILHFLSHHNTSNIEYWFIIIIIFLFF